MNQTLDIFVSMLIWTLVVSLLLLAAYALYVPFVTVPRLFVRLTQVVSVCILMVSVLMSCPVVVNQCSAAVSLREASNDAHVRANLSATDDALAHWIEFRAGHELKECTVLVLQVTTIVAFAAGIGIGMSKLHRGASPQWLAGMAIGFVSAFCLWLLIAGENLSWPLVSGAGFIVGFAVSSAATKRASRSTHVFSPAPRLLARPSPPYPLSARERGK